MSGSAGAYTINFIFRSYTLLLGTMTTQVQANAKQERRAEIATRVVWVGGEAPLPNLR